MNLGAAVPSALLGALLLLGACGGDPGPVAGEEKEEVPSDAARTEKELGPVKAVLEAEPGKGRLSDEITLILTIEAEQDVKVNKPPFGESLGAFIIRDFREPLPELRGDRRIIRQIYTLEPTDTGELSIWPISFTFQDERPDGDGKEHTLETEGLVVEIQSALETEAPSLANIIPPTGPKEVPEDPPPYWIYASSGAIVLAAAVLLIIILRRKRAEPIEKKYTPQELAFMEFQKLLDAGLVDRDIKLFYVELTGIVRRYIERTKGVRAPEQTTEEFLREISGAAFFPPDEQERLARFLEAADLVKFAAFEPGKKEIEESFQRAKIFIGLEREEAA